MLVILSILSAILINSAFGATEATAELGKHEAFFRHALDNINTMDLEITKFKQRQRLDPDLDLDNEEEISEFSEDNKSVDDDPSHPPPKPLIIKSHPILSSFPISSSSPVVNVNVVKSVPNKNKQSGVTPAPGGKATSSEENEFIKGSSMDANLKSQLDDLFSKVTSYPHPTFIPAALPSSEGFLNSFQHIKDAYFEVLEKMRDFRNNVTKRFERVEEQIREVARELNKTVEIPIPIPAKPIVTSEAEGMTMPDIVLKLTEMERRYNISRLVDHCVYYILANNLEEASTLWNKLEAITAPNAPETSDYLREIIKLAYTRNNSNESPIYPFLRRLNGVEKIPLYSILISGMKIRDDYNGTEIFYIAQYLKERNAVRSSIYSKIPKAVQYAVSGRNINIVYSDPKSGRNYLHVRDDQDRKNRLNFYIQASQSYTDTRAAVWNVVFEPSMETFRIRNALYGDYMYINDEGFLETLPATAVTTRPGTEFNFVLKKDMVVIHSKGFRNDPLAVIRGGGKYPYYFSLQRENPYTPIATFLVEPDTLLRK